jgi:hypothetical protein
VEETTMETLRALPDIAGRKFGNVSVGYDRIDQIRTEVATLETLASWLCGVPREDLTLEKVQRTLGQLQSSAASLTAEDREKYRDEEPQKLLAIALDRLT